MPVTVYRINEFPSEDNRYGIDRRETWVLTTEGQYADADEAFDRVIALTAIHVPAFTNLALGLTGEQRQRFAEQFCFHNDLYLKHRRFFIGLPNVRRFKDAVRADGVQI
jgi:hypothetical protein